MPHAGLMEEKKLGPVYGPFQRARLHLRAGKRRLRQGKISAGIATLFDALTGAMEFYAQSPNRNPALKAMAGEELKDEKVLYRALVRSGVLDGSFDFEGFELLMERALSEEVTDLEYEPLVKGIESVFSQLGVMPFDESLLPPEDPTTF